MGYLILTSLRTGKTEFLGDAVDYEKMKRDQGLPTAGKPQSKLDADDKQGE